MISRLIWNQKIRLMLVLSALAPICSQALAADSAWPRNLEFDLGVIQLYEPDIERIEGNRVDALAAVAIKTGSNEPVFAAISFSGISESASAAPEVTIHDIELTGLHFGKGVDQHPHELVTALEQQLADLTLSVSRSDLTTPGQNIKAVTRA